MTPSDSVLSEKGIPTQAQTRFLALLKTLSRNGGGVLCLMMCRNEFDSLDAPLLKALRLENQAVSFEFDLTSNSGTALRVWAGVLDADAFTYSFGRLSSVLEQGGTLSHQPTVTHFLLPCDGTDLAIEALLTPLTLMSGTVLAMARGGILRVGVSDPQNGQLAPMMPQMPLAERLAEGSLMHAAQGIFPCRTYPETAQDLPDRFELLARFTAASGDSLTAGQVLSDSEPDSALAALDRAMLETAVERLRRSDSVKLTVNVCRSTLYDPVWLNQIETLAETIPETMDRLILEITEWPFRAAGYPLEGPIEWLTSLGVSVWLDDFGAGLTSVNEALLPGLSGIKIDRSLLRHGLATNDALGLLAGTSAFAAQRGKVCVVEGAENEAERAFAERLGASHVQGFFSGVV